MFKKADVGLDALLAHIADSVIHEGYSLLRVSVCVLSTDGSALRFVSVWGASSGVIFPGATMHVGATVFPEVVRVGGAVTSGAVEETLAAEVVRYEGVRAWLTVPLRNELALPVGLLNFSSVDPKAFPSESIPFFEKIGTEVEAKVLALVSV